jgi:hypothetical protein
MTSTGPTALPEQPHDPALFAPLTNRENSILGAHLNSGWYKQSAVYPLLSGPWQETGGLLDDLHDAHRAARQARAAAQAQAGLAEPEPEVGA